MCVCVCVCVGLTILIQDYSYDFDLTVSEGDIVEMSVTAGSNTTGTVVLDNLTTGKSVTHSFKGNVQGDLCRTNAEWIVEDVSRFSDLKRVGLLLHGHLAVPVPPPPSPKGKKREYVKHRDH